MNENQIKDKIESIAGKETVQFVKIDCVGKTNYQINKARVVMKKKEFGQLAIDKQSKIYPLKVEWFVPLAERKFKQTEQYLTGQVNQLKEILQSQMKFALQIINPEFASKTMYQSEQRQEQKFGLNFGFERQSQSIPDILRINPVKNIRPQMQYYGQDPFMG
ncbi:MAG: hypothetical protein EZS28_052710, partial [Streblomastix strix]